MGRKRIPIAVVALVGITLAVISIAPRQKDGAESLDHAGDDPLNGEHSSERHAAESVARRTHSTPEVANGDVNRGESSDNKATRIAVAQERPSHLRYGPGSIPAQRSPERFQLEYDEPVRVSTRPGQGIVRTQNRVFLSATEEGGIRLRPLDGAAPISVGTATVYRLQGANTLNQIGTLQLRDDGVGADELASDGQFGAGVIPAAFDVARAPTRLIVRVPVTQAGDPTEIEFLFEYTGAAPAEILAVESAGVVEGSLLLRVRVRVHIAGLYNWVGRLTRDSNIPVALLKASAQLEVDDASVDLVAHGLLLREQGAVQNLVLRDVEGWRIRIGGSLPKEVVPPWRGSLRVGSVDARSLTAEPWNGAVKLPPILPRPRAVPAQRR